MKSTVLSRILRQAACCSLLLLNCATLRAQTAGPAEAPSPAAADSLAILPPMGWMSWNLVGDTVNDRVVRQMADAMVEGGYRDAGYQYIFIDDGWQGGRDRRNNIIPAPEKFPYGMKALADYVHSRGLKLGIYSDASQLTCAGFTASYGFEEQDARTFAEWGVDYLKYDYCYAPTDLDTAKQRYRAMADALRKSGRRIVLGVCEWGPRQPWHWAHEVGGQLWRCTYDVRDMWRDIVHQGGMGIIDIINQTDTLGQYAGPGHWNDLDMLVVGLRGGGRSSSDLGGVGCTDDEYATQMAMWCMLSSPLAMTNDLRHVDEATRSILLNRELIAINQDPLGHVARPAGGVSGCRLYVRELSDGRTAIAVLNDSETAQRPAVSFARLGIAGKRMVRDAMAHKDLGRRSSWRATLRPHQTAVLVLSK